MSQCTRLCGIAALALALVSSGGCSAGTDRQEVSGNVTFKQQPLEYGLIEFWPDEGQGTKVSAMISNGAYVIPSDKGLMPGKYKIMIMAGDGRGADTTAGPDEAPGPRDIPHPGRKRTPGRERIPPQYNEKTTLIREVVRGPNRFDFDIP